MGRVINPTVSLNKFRVGLNGSYLTLQVTWHDDGCWISWTIDRHASIKWTCGPPAMIKTRAELKDYNGYD